MARKDQQDPPKKSKFSLIGAMFNPNLGRSFGDLSQSWQGFVRTIASMFVSAQLIRRDHPMLAAGRNLSLTQVLREGFENVVWDFDHAPQIVMFCAVAGGLFFVCMLLLIGLLSLSSHRHK